MEELAEEMMKISMQKALKAHTSMQQIDTDISAVYPFLKSLILSKSSEIIEAYKKENDGLFETFELKNYILKSSFTILSIKLKWNNEKFNFDLDDVLSSDNKLLYDRYHESPSYFKHVMNRLIKHDFGNEFNFEMETNNNQLTFTLIYSKTINLN
jgi:hypothetical protein